MGSVAGRRPDPYPMTEALMYTFICLLFCGAAATVLIAARPASSADCDDEATERLVTIEELVAEFDHMLIRKGLLTPTQLALIRHGTHSHGVITGLRALQDFREVQLDLIVSKPGGGQFPARETTLIPTSSLAKVAPGSVVDAYYRPGSEDTVAVCVSPG